MNFLKTIEHNIKTDFEVLSDYVFLKDNLYYLSSPDLKPPLKNYKFKYLRSDQDGVCEAEGTPQLSYLHFMEMVGKKDADFLLETIFEKPIEEQEKEICEFLKENRIDANKFLLASKMAAKKYRPAKNLFQFAVTVQKKLSYYLDVRSGVFGEARINGKSFDGPLKLVWKHMGLSSEQIGGSIAYFDEDGILRKIELELEHKKSKPLPNHLQYVIGFTDNLVGDFPMINVDINILPLAFSFNEFVEIPRGIVIPCQEARKNMMETIKPILKVERGVVESFGKIDIARTKEIGEEVKRLYEIFYANPESLFQQKDIFVNKTLGFLDSLCVKVGEKKYPIFPESFTRIRKKLKMLKYLNDNEIAKELTEEIIASLKKYSAEFPK